MPVVNCNPTSGPVRYGILYRSHSLASLDPSLLSNVEEALGLEVTYLFLEVPYIIGVEIIF